MPSFDVVSKVDLQEVENAVNQARKEVAQRYDFRGSNTEIEWNKTDTIRIESADDFKVKATDDVLQEKLVRRGVSLKSLDPGRIEPGPSGRAKQEIVLKQGIDTDRARKLTKRIKDLKVKVQAQIQGDQLRISGKKKDDLQTAMQALRETDLDLPLQFVNFRD